MGSAVQANRKLVEAGPPMLRTAELVDLQLKQFFRSLMTSWKIEQESSTRQSRRVRQWRNDLGRVFASRHWCSDRRRPAISA